ncbi:MAG TPA: hypothetical protein VGG42_01960 [Acidobacteriaceae bacterium]
MRTTLAIDDDVLAAARGMAALQRKSVGEIISFLARKALTPQDVTLETRNGIPLLPLRLDARPVTLEMVNVLRDEMP